MSQQRFVKWGHINPRHQGATLQISRPVVAHQQDNGITRQVVIDVFERRVRAVVFRQVRAFVFMAEDVIRATVQ